MADCYKLIPILSTTQNQDSLERYLMEMAEASKLKIVENENLLIFGSLQKSSKFDIYTSLKTQEKTSLQHFAKFMRHNYGSNTDEKRYEFANLTQGPDESPNEFIRRVERNFYQIKGLTVPAKVEGWEASEIKWSFISGLTDPFVKKYLILNDCEYDQLGTTARKIEKTHKGLSSVYNVNYITDQHQIEDLEGPIDWSQDSTDGPFSD